jgi:hypothetical protein
MRGCKSKAHALYSTINSCHSILNFFYAHLSKTS